MGLFLCFFHPYTHVVSVPCFCIYIGSAWKMCNYCKWKSRKLKRVMERVWARFPSFASAQYGAPLPVCTNQSFVLSASSPAYAPRWSSMMQYSILPRPSLPQPANLPSFVPSQRSSVRHRTSQQHDRQPFAIFHLAKSLIC